MTDLVEEAFSYENTLSIEQLRTEVRRGWDESHTLNRALVDLPEIPDVIVLGMLTNAAMNIRGIDLWGRGKRMQDGQGYNGPIPYKCEYEHAAGLWEIIRDALLAEKAAAIRALADKP